MSFGNSTDFPLSNDKEIFMTVESNLQKNISNLFIVEIISLKITKSTKL